MERSKQRWRALTGLDYPTGRGTARAEAGDVVDDLPAASVSWLLAQGHIDPVPGDEAGDSGQSRAGGEGS